MKTTISRDAIHSYIKPQTVIWRPLFVYNGVMMRDLHRIAFRQDTHDPMFRVNLTGAGQAICEPCISTDGKGMICFIKGAIPEQWTHLVVMRSGKSGNVLLAMPECLPSVDDYIAWRLSVAALYHSQERYNEDDLAKRIAAFSCPGLQLNRVRMQLFSDSVNYVLHGE